MDRFFAVQHDAHVSSIFLQENRFNPPPGGYFFARLFSVSRQRRPAFLILFGARVPDLHNPRENACAWPVRTRSSTHQRVFAAGLSTIFRSRPVCAVRRLVLLTGPGQHDWNAGIEPEHSSTTAIACDAVMCHGKSVDSSRCSRYLRN